MGAETVTVRGRIKPDGSLELDQKPSLPEGEVQVSIQPLAKSPQPERFWKMMESIWADLKAAGRNPRTREEIDAEIAALRDEAEEEMQAVERLHEECSRNRKNPEVAQ